jgi:hypothetical protein
MVRRVGAEPVIERHSGRWQRRDEQFLTFSAVLPAGGCAVTEVHEALGDVPPPRVLPVSARPGRGHPGRRVQGLVLGEIGVIIVGKDPPDLSLVTQVRGQPVVTQASEPVMLFERALVPLTEHWILALGITTGRIEGARVELRGLRPVGRVQVGDDTVGDELRVPLRDVTQGVCPLLAPHVREPVADVQVTDETQPGR